MGPLLIASKRVKNPFSLILVFFVLIRVIRVIRGFSVFRIESGFARDRPSILAAAGPDRRPRRPGRRTGW